MPTRKILNYLHIGHFLDHYFLMIFPFAVLAIERDWNLPYADALALGTPLYIGFAIGTLIAGWLGDHYPGEYLLAVLFIGCGLGSLLVAISTTTFWFMGGLMVLGFFASIYHPVGLSMITRLSQKPGQTLALNGVYGNLGLAASSLFTAILADHFGWRSAFLLPGIIALIIGYLCSRNCLGIRHCFASKTDSQKSLSLNAGHFAQRRIILVVMTAAFFGGMIFNGVTITLPKFFELRLHGISDRLTEIGTYSAIVFAVASFAQLPVGYLLDRFGARLVLINLLALQAVTLLFLANSQGLPTVILSMLLVLLMFAEIPVTAWIVGRYVPESWRSRVFSIEYLLSLGMNAVMIPGLAIAFAWGLSFSELYTAFAVSALIVCGVAVILPVHRQLVKDKPVC